MIGAMPAVAVRHERRRQEKRKRPSLLYLQSGLPASDTPSPAQSLPGVNNSPPLEIYIFGKISLFHLAVVTLLCGAISLFIGLVQLKPGASASKYRYIFIGCGLLASLIGIVLSILRCCLLPIVAKRREKRRREYRRQQCAQYCCIENGGKHARLTPHKCTANDGNTAAGHFVPNPTPVDPTLVVDDQLSDIIVESK